VNAASLHANGPPTADNVLINGSMTSSFGGRYAETTLTPGKSHLLRIINVGINNWNHVGLDGHKFTVVSADFIPIVPYETDSINIAVGKSRDSFPVHETTFMQATPHSRKRNDFGGTLH
jgi:FtsP/CotA-like multicopper oxidase with cupredoxin domain